MVEFKPIEYGFDEVGYTRANRDAELKLKMLDEMLVWCANKDIYIKSKKDMQMFAVDPVNHFKYLWFEKNSKKIELSINVDKLLDLSDINVSELKQLARKYEANRSELSIADDKKTKLFKYCVQVDRNKFARFTTSEEQNKKVKAINSFLKEVKKLEKDVCKIYPYDLCMALNGGNLIRYNTREEKYDLMLV